MTTAAASPSAGAIQNSEGEQSKKARGTGDDGGLGPIKQRALRRASLEFGMFAVISHGGTRLHLALQGRVARFNIHILDPPARPEQSKR